MENHQSKKQLILNTALKMACERGYSNITRDGLAEILGVSQGLITHYFRPFAKLKREVLQLAIDRSELPVLMQALGSGDITKSHLTPTVKAQLMQFLL